MQSAGRVRSRLDLLLDVLTAGDGQRCGDVGQHVGCGPHVILAADLGAGDGDVDCDELRSRFPGVQLVAHDGALRALLPVVRGADQRTVHGALKTIAQHHGWVAGFSAIRTAIEVRSLIEAQDARRVARLVGTAVALGYESLGAYRYLVPLLDHIDPDETHARVVATLLDYDRRRRTQLLATLECFLDQHASAVATARCLLIHVNTVRQRLQRAENLTGMDLAAEDLTTLGFGVKLGRLRLDTSLWRGETAAAALAIAR